MSPLPDTDSQEWIRPERIQRLLLSPTFPIHALWIATLAVLAIVSPLQLLLKLTFICCTVGVETLTGEANRFV